MEKEIISMVQSPARGHKLREGDGFSLAEVEKSNKSIQQLKDLGVRIDYRRRTSYKYNIEKLNSIEVSKEKKEKRTPFVKKEKKTTPFKPREEREEPEKPAAKKEKVEKPKKKQKKEAKAEIIPLTKLHRLGPKTEEKFKEIGVNSVNDLIKENPEDIGTLVDGCSEDSVKSWIDEGKKLLKK